MPQYWECDAHKKLEQLAASGSSVKTHLRELLKDEKRSDALTVSVDSCAGPILCDFSRQKVDSEVVESLVALANERDLHSKIAGMFGGEKINETEKRSVLHTALRCGDGDQFKASGEDVTKDVKEVLNHIADFSSKVRSGGWKGCTGEQLTDVVCIGIGGSYLGPEFVYEAMRTYPACQQDCAGRRLRFLANVDPIDVSRAVEGLKPATTLVIIISKTFTTAETMLNARTLREWLVKDLGTDPSVVAKHMVAVSTNSEATKEFGIDSNNVFGFWNWVGGRFSVCSAVGALPLALHFGMPQFQQFLDGCRMMDKHFQSAPFEHNLPVMMGLIGVWNATYLKHSSVAVLPYCQALLRFAAHIQQVTMESNGKRVTMDGQTIPGDCGEVFFGEPGTNGQHSFYQLIHQGRVVPADFIGFVKSQVDITSKEHQVSNHDELMSNFFAQPDALALGKTPEQLKAEQCPTELVAHKTFPGDRPSTSLLMPVCSPFFTGALLSLYEHRTAVQGFVWGVNSFDQWGVELGKVLAKNVRGVLEECRKSKRDMTDESLPLSTRKLIKAYCQV